MPLPGQIQIDGSGRCTIDQYGRPHLTPADGDCCCGGEPPACHYRANICTPTPGFAPMVAVACSQALAVNNGQSFVFMLGKAPNIACYTMALPASPLNEPVGVPIVDASGIVASCSACDPGSCATFNAGGFGSSILFSASGFNLYGGNAGSPPLCGTSHFVAAESFPLAFTTVMGVQQYLGTKSQVISNFTWTITVTVKCGGPSAVNPSGGVVADVKIVVNNAQGAACQQKAYIGGYGPLPINLTQADSQFGACGLNADNLHCLNHSGSIFCSGTTPVGAELFGQGGFSCAIEPTPWATNANWPQGITLS